MQSSGNGDKIMQDTHTLSNFAYKDGKWQRFTDTQYTSYGW